MNLALTTYQQRTLKAKLDVPIKSLQRLILEQRDSTDYLHIDHSHHSAQDSNLIRLSRVDPKAKDLLVELASKGYYVYSASAGTTKFVRHEAIRKLWHSIRDGVYRITDDDMVYTVTGPVIPDAAQNLLVVFSSIGSDIYNPGLSRYFTQNYQSVQKFIPANTVVLRIADIGGVQGSFYLNTTYDPNNAAKIQRLIGDVCREQGISRDRVVLYGASKGGTGALYHGLLGDFRAVAVDPIVNDDYYVRRYGDTHFTLGGVFASTKEQVFADLMNTEQMSTSISDSSRQVVICSELSPQFAYTNEILIDHNSRGLAFYNVVNPNIKDHPDVSSNTLDLAVTLINGHFYDLRIDGGLHNVQFRHAAESSGS